MCKFMLIIKPGYSGRIRAERPPRSLYWICVLAPYLCLSCDVSFGRGHLRNYGHLTMSCESPVCWFWGSASIFFPRLELLNITHSCGGRDSICCSLIEFYVLANKLSKWGLLQGGKSCYMFLIKCFVHREGVRLF